MDIVYVCRSGENEELRYSLRSLVNIPHDKVWVFGDAPDWFKGKVIPTPQDSSKYRNVYQAMVQVCANNKVSENFILMNDDFFCMNPIKEIPNVHRGSAEKLCNQYKRAYPRAKYTALMMRTIKFMQLIGISKPRSYELHIPMVLNKSKLTHILALTNNFNGLQFRSIFGNIFGTATEAIDDVKVYKKSDRIPEGDWLSCSDESFAYVLPLLQKRFPQPSKYEKG